MKTSMFDVDRAAVLGSEARDESLAKPAKLRCDKMSMRTSLVLANGVVVDDVQGGLPGNAVERCERDDAFWVKMPDRVPGSGHPRSWYTLDRIFQVSSALRSVNWSV